MCAAVSARQFAAVPRRRRQGPEPTVLAGPADDATGSRARNVSYPVGLDHSLPGSSPSCAAAGSCRSATSPARRTSHPRNSQVGADLTPIIFLGLCGFHACVRLLFNNWQDGPCAPYFPNDFMFDLCISCSHEVEPPVAFLINSHEGDLCLVLVLSQMFYSVNRNCLWCRHLPFLERVVLESLRLRPPAYMVGRCAAHDDILASYSVRQGKTVSTAAEVLMLFMQPLLNQTAEPQHNTR